MTDKLLEILNEKNILRPRLPYKQGSAYTNFTQEVKVMARLKRSSNVLETARLRLSGLKSITPKPDYGSALDIDDYEQDINDLGTSLDKYNETLSLLDSLQNELDGKEAKVKDKNRRMLAATGAQYGPNSSQYEQVGGTRTTDRKRPTATKKKPGSS